jgi:signal peptidase II
MISAGRSTTMGFAGFLLTLFADQVSKVGILRLSEGAGWSLPVTDFFNIVLVFNRGVSFGMFGEAGLPYQHLILAGLAILVTLVLLSWIRKNLYDRPCLAYGLIAGGALGNAIDRIRIGAVVDFLDFHWQGYHWPAFNVADSAIFIGVVLVLIDALFGSDEESKKNANV